MSGAMWKHLWEAGLDLRSIGDGMIVFEVRQSELESSNMLILDKSAILELDEIVGRSLRRGLEDS